MTPISEMSLQECIDALQDDKWFSNNPYHCYVKAVADRIEELTTTHQFISDGKGTFATKCICGKEKWKHL